MPYGCKRVTFHWREVNPLQHILDSHEAKYTFPEPLKTKIVINLHWFDEDWSSRIIFIRSMNMNILQMIINY